MGVYIKEIYLEIRRTEKDHTLILFKIMIILDSGEMISLMEKASKSSETGATMKDLFIMVLKMDSVIMYVNQVFTKDNSKMEFSQEKELSIILTTGLIKAHGMTDY